MDGDTDFPNVADSLSELRAQVKQQNSQMSDELTQLETAVEEKVVTETKNRLENLQTAINRIPSPAPPPKTTLQIQNQADIEGAWQNYLQYFLNPDANHGLGTDALVQFLRGINSVSNRAVPTRISENVSVDDEVGSPNGNIPDIVIRDSEEFFLCCELKLYSSEGDEQTHRYVNDPYIGSTQKSRFPEGDQHYVYIRRPDRPGAKADEFVDVTWHQIREWFEPLLFNNQGRYPTRTTAQLTDFLDTIQQDMTQDEHIQTAQEKMQLYFDHEDAIREAEEGLNTVYEYEVQNWRRRFVEGYLPDNWGEEWHTNPNQYGQIYHTKWRQDGGLAVDNTEIKLHFVHLIRNKDSFTDGKLTFQLRMPNGGPYRKRFEKLFISEQFSNELDPLLGRYDIDKGPGMDYSNPRLTGKTYPVVKSGLPESYYETLQQATREHIEVATVINDILDTAIEEVETDL